MSASKIIGWMGSDPEGHCARVASDNSAGDMRKISEIIQRMWPIKSAGVVDRIPRGRFSPISWLPVEHTA